MRLGAVAQTRTSLDGGGSVHWAGASASGKLDYDFSAALSAGVTLKYAYEDWRFSQSNALGASAPWSEINAPSVRFSVGYQVAEDLSLFVAPQWGWTYEAGASARNGQTYGAVGGLTRIFSPRLTLGVGAGVFRQIDQTRIFPSFIVNWQISDRWRLANAFEAGPAGGPGLELVYDAGNGWELAGGAAYRGYRFRLRDSGPSAGGLGQNSGIPLFARASYTVGRSAKLDTYAGAVVGGELRMLSGTGSTLAKSDYDIAPMFGLSATVSF